MAEFSPLILDTQVWLWTMAGSRDRLTANAIDEIVACADQGRLFISAISIWQVAMLEARGRIRMARRIDEWVNEALSAPGTHLLPSRRPSPSKAAAFPARCMATRPTAC